jgi:hypothetical protein
MGTNNFNFSEQGIFALPFLSLMNEMRASGPDDDTKTLVTPEDQSLSEVEVSAEAPQDGGSGPDDDTKTQ